MPVQRAKQHSPVGRCIYCGAAGPQLTREHIVPFGLGGTEVLPQASCARCAEITSKIEHTALRKLYGPLRLYVRSKTRHPEKRPETLPLLASFPSEAAPRLVEVPLDRYPPLCALVRMDPPRLLAAADGGEKEVLGVMPRGLLETDLQLRELASELGATNLQVEASLDPQTHRLFLAKVAHCLVVAKFGLDGFRPYLPGLLLAGDGEGLKDFVGCALSDTERLPKHGRENHRLSIHVGGGSGKMLLARIEFFSRFGCPAYDVLCGELV